MARKNVLHRLLTSPEPPKAVKGAGGILFSLYWDILRTLKISPQKFTNMVQAYFSSPISGVRQNAMDQTSARGNLVKELTKTEMTWKVFFKGLKILQLRNIKIEFYLTHNNGKTTVHSVDIPLAVARKEQEEHYGDDW